MKKRIYFLLGVIFFTFIFYPSQALTQEDVKESFINNGLISISDLYSVPSKENIIVFRIKNNTARTISQIYGWVYMFDKGSDGKGKNFVLLNNPHKGGNNIKNKPHQPGKISEWSFSLAREPSIESQEIGYTLRVHPRSIFFASIEQTSK
jgi:hypothetical protein